MKKKNFVTSKDKKDWNAFIKKAGTISDKESYYSHLNNEDLKYRKIDLHGYSLDEANKIVKNFIIDSFSKNFRKVLIVTGKGTRSKSVNNPYISEKLSILKYSIPDFIQNDESLRNKIYKISNASEKDGGDGAIYIFLKKNKQL